MFDVEVEGELRPQMDVMLIVFGRDGEKQIPINSHRYAIESLLQTRRHPALRLRQLLSRG